MESCHLETEHHSQNLRAKNGKDKATRRSWEIHRGALQGFFAWCAKADAASNRPFTFTNPVEGTRKFSARQVREEQDAKPVTSVFSGPVIPPDFERLNKKVRKHFGLSHDEARHSFISDHVALHRSIGDAALQAGNSEAIVKRHYLNTHTREEGGEFFRIVPDPKRRRAVLAPEKEVNPNPHLVAV